jgi:hypothetical protein
LLTACAGAVAEAERSSCRRALMLVHEFVSDRTTSQNHQNNTADLDRFVNLMSHGAVPAVEPGVAAGPFEIPYAPLFNGTARLFIAKVQRDLRKQPAK